MPNDANNKYILDQLNAGYTFDQIVGALVSSGWNQSDASAAVASAARLRQNVPAAVATPSAQNDLASLSQNSQHVGYQSRPMPRGNIVAAPCPYCRAQSANSVGFTWWGGLLGPRIMGIVKCNNCHNQFTKNGNKAGGAIGIYLGISLAIGLIIGVVIVAASMAR
jgi:hypothetical protein